MKVNVQETFTKKNLQDFTKFNWGSTPNSGLLNFDTSRCN